VSLGGAVHALEPLLYAFDRDQILMISEPSVCMGALWLPYRRNNTIMKNILQQIKAEDEISAVFCHADVKGALMNEGVRSTDGIDLEAFPKNTPVYSGHFHKPHSMTSGVAGEKRSITYLGSPYQVSLSEAYQDKYLYSFTSSPDSNGNCMWKEESKWKINCGKKHYMVCVIPNTYIFTYCNCLSHVTDSIIKRSSHICD
jgi:hypothetical protein